MDTKGYYATLGVSEQAKYNEIRAAYRCLAKKYHPDVSTSLLAEETIKRINEAFEVLSDKEKRRLYDETHFDDDNNVHLKQSHKHEYTSKTNTHDSYTHSSRKSEATKGTYGLHSDSNNNNSSKYNRYYRRGAKLQSKISAAPPDTLAKSRFNIIVEPSLCMAFGSCETLAPKVFVVEKDKIFNPKAKVVSETAEDFDAILSAAQTCPTKAIIIIDRSTGERIYP